MLFLSKTRSDRAVGVESASPFFNNSPLHRGKGQKEERCRTCHRSRENAVPRSNCRHWMGIAVGHVPKRQAPNCGPSSTSAAGINALRPCWRCVCLVAVSVASCGTKPALDASPSNQRMGRWADGTEAGQRRYFGGGNGRIGRSADGFAQDLLLPTTVLLEPRQQIRWGRCLHRGKKP